MTKKNFLLLSFPVIVFGMMSSIAIGFLMTGGDFTSLLTEIVTFGSKIVSSDGKVSVTQSVGSINLGSEKITGGDYEVVGNVGGQTGISVGPSVNLDNVKVYPNPYKPGSGTIYDNPSFGEGIVFSGLTANAKIKIYNIAGELVTELDVTTNDGKYLWNTRNFNGQKVASGVYIYFITNPDDNKQKSKGRFAIIR